MPTAYIPTIVGAGATVAVTKAVFGRRKKKAKTRKAKAKRCKCPSCKPKKAGKNKTRR